MGKQAKLKVLRRTIKAIKEIKQIESVEPPTLGVAVQENVGTKDKFGG